MNPADRIAIAELIDRLGEALQANSNSPDVYNNRGAARHALRDFPGAISDFNQAIALQADYAEALNNRGATRHALRDFHSAVSDFTEALRINPLYADAYNNRAASQYAQHNLAEAIRDYDQALKIYRSAPNCDLHRVAMVHLFRGDARYHHDNDPTGLLDDYRVAFLIDTDLCSRITIRRLASDAITKLDQILADCDRHLKNDPDDYVSHARRGLVLLLNRRDAEAQAGFDLFKMKNPGDRETIVEPLIQKALLHRALGAG